MYLQSGSTVQHVPRWLDTGQRNEQAALRLVLWPCKVSPGSDTHAVSTAYAIHLPRCRLTLLRGDGAMFSCCVISLSFKSEFEGGGRGAILSPILRCSCTHPEMYLAVLSISKNALGWVGVCRWYYYGLAALIFLSLSCERNSHARRAGAHSRPAASARPEASLLQRRGPPRTSASFTASHRAPARQPPPTFSPKPLFRSDLCLRPLAIPPRSSPAV